MNPKIDQPREQEQEKLDLPVFDGDLQEADNPIPRWWLALFLFTIGFSIFYFVWFHMMAIGPSLQDELKIAVAKAKLEQEERDRLMMAKLEATATPAEIGAKYFKNFCVSCHGQEGEGGIGPNLHDNYWIHEPTAASLTNVVFNGVSAKGMPAWGPILGERKVKGLVAYVMTLKDVPLKIPGKAPEGKEYSKEQLSEFMSNTTK
ncbi:MAG: c-type cytochrome [bacterium]|nr:c-type cytochrome [bacterium]